ncbi:MAG: (Fe-S)-binding protein [Gemmatimonadales bacterium]
MTARPSDALKPAAPVFTLPGAENCVHCGFCLQACPTYLALDDENDSPRGRIVLMKALADGTLSPDDAGAQLHIDRCLGCRACETACPSGVPYGELLELTRERGAARRALPLVARLILFVFSRPLLLKISMWKARVLRATGIPAALSGIPGRIGFGMAMLASTRRNRRDSSRVYDPRRLARDADPHGGRSRGRVATLEGCVMEGLFTAANRATERVLSANGYALVGAQGQRCCGALHAHAGDAATARELARANIAAFEASGAEFVAVNSAGCGAAMKEYAHLLAADDAWRDRARAFGARVRDVSELLSEAGPRRGGALPMAVAYDAPCHLLHGQRISAPPLTVLAAIPELTRVPLADSEQCCGSAGIYNLVEPDMSNLVLAPKLANIEASGAAIIATGNPGCLMQIGAGLLRSGSRAQLRHPVELLDESYERLG